MQVRYKQAVLGGLWTILQPLATMVVFTLFLGKMGTGAATNVPYPLFVLSGLLPWIFFSNAIGDVSQSVVGSQNLVTKVYFPRLIIPIGAVGASLVNLLVSFGLLVVFMLYYAVMPGWGLMLLPVLVLLLVLAVLGLGTLLSALMVAYRDFRHVVPSMLQTWMFATPCIYMRTDLLVNSRSYHVLPLNPAYGLVANFRAAVLGLPLDGYALGVSTIVTLTLLIVGCYYFRKVEGSFADII